jgi:hypothetical protein
MARRPILSRREPSSPGNHGDGSGLLREKLHPLGVERGAGSLGRSRPLRGMDFAGCRHCYRAARNRKSGRRERVEQPWQRSEPPEWIDEARLTTGRPGGRANDKRSGPIRKWAVLVDRLGHLVPAMSLSADSNGGQAATIGWESSEPVAPLAVGGALIGVVVYALLTGIRPPSSSARMSAMEYGINRFGGDYRSVEASEPQVCQDTCAREAQCVAFTFVKPGVQAQTGVCWLKDRVSLPNPDANCVSGIKK